MKLYTRSSVKLVPPDRLADAVARYMDYEALAYWARPALEYGPNLPQEVARELTQRCPGYSDTLPKNEASAHQGGAQEWDCLMLWIGDHFFENAKREGWFDAILIQVRNHPRGPWNLRITATRSGATSCRTLSSSIADRRCLRPCCRASPR